MTLQVYWQIFSINWSNGLVYRTSLLLWRLRQVISTLMALTIWTTAYTSATPQLSYNQSQMITYIFLTGILQSIVLATALQGLTTFIYSGQLSFLLTKPINIYSYLATQDLADKLKNVLFIVLESILLYLIFRPSVIWPDLSGLMIFGLVVMAGVVMNFFISLIFGAFGFWSPESWGPRFLFYTLIMFTSGTLFPLDILPQTIQTIMYLTPLPYLSFVQTQIFLGRVDGSELTPILLGLVFWILVLGLGAVYLWRKGLRNYSAMGN